MVRPHFRIRALRDQQAGVQSRASLRGQRVGPGPAGFLARMSMEDGRTPHPSPESVPGGRPSAGRGHTTCLCAYPDRDQYWRLWHVWRIRVPEGLPPLVSVSGSRWASRQWSQAEAQACREPRQQGGKKGPGSLSPAPQLSPLCEPWEAPRLGHGPDGKMVTPCPRWGPGGGEGLGVSALASGSLPEGPRVS